MSIVKNNPIFSVNLTKIGNKIDPTIDSFVFSFPKNIYDRIIQKIDDIKINKGLSMEKYLFIIILNPDTPPKTISLGEINKLNDIAIIKTPKTSSIVLNNLCFL